MLPFVYSCRHENTNDVNIKDYEGDLSKYSQVVLSLNSCESTNNPFNILICLSNKIYHIRIC